MASSRTRGSSLLLLLALGCQRLDVESSDEGPTPGDTTGSTSGESEGSSASDESDEGTDPETGGSVTFDCDPIAQTGCNPDEKCTVVLQAGDVNYTCVADDISLEPLGDCESALETGTDGCPAGYACLDDENDQGLCVPLCLDSGDCDNAVCLPELEHGIPYCAAECSPFEGGCAAPLQCRRLNDQFACSFARPDDVGGQGEPCTTQEDAGCGEGFVCLPGGLVPSCSSDNCCSTVCDVLNGECESPSTCVPLFDSPAPGSESIGACFVPS